MRSSFFCLSSTQMLLGVTKLDDTRHSGHALQPTSPHYRHQPTIITNINASTRPLTVQPLCRTSSLHATYVCTRGSRRDCSFRADQIAAHVSAPSQAPAPCRCHTASSDSRQLRTSIRPPQSFRPCMPATKNITYTLLLLQLGTNKTNLSMSLLLFFVAGNEARKEADVAVFTVNVRACFLKATFTLHQERTEFHCRPASFFWLCFYSKSRPSSTAVRAWVYRISLGHLH